MALAAADYHRRQHRFVPTLGLDPPRLEASLILEQLRKGEFSVLGPDGLPLMDSHAQGHHSPSPAAFAYSLARYFLLRLRSCMVWLWRPTRDRLFPRPDHLLGR